MILLVAALGYFVDVFDLTMFSIVRIPSLSSLGVPPAEALATGARLLSLQQAGLLLGGILWGVWGDRAGRVRVLFGSILVYSAATLANAFVTSIAAYAALRFLAGAGLAAELGAAVTLVGETMPRHSRGWGTALVAATGLLGAAAAALVAARLSWRPAYIAGGVLGLLLLSGRAAVHESPLFRNMARSGGDRRGDLALLFASPARAGRYFLCVLAGLPICAAIGVLVYFSPEIASGAGSSTPVSAGAAITAAYLGMSAGDLACGALSQALGSRRRAIAAFTLALAALSAAFGLSRGLSGPGILLVCAALGFASGYWVVLVTQSAELFGTNLRATVATSVPNFVRGLNAPLALAFGALAAPLGAPNAALLIAGACCAAGLAALFLLPETFGRSLRFTEK